MDKVAGGFSVTRFSITTIDVACQRTDPLIPGQFVEHSKSSFPQNSAYFMSPSLKRHPGTLDRDSMDRASAVFGNDGV